MYRRYVFNTWLHWLFLLLDCSRFFCPFLKILWCYKWLMHIKYQCWKLRWQEVAFCNMYDQIDPYPRQKINTWFVWYSMHLNSMLRRLCPTLTRNLRFGSNSTSYCSPREKSPFWLVEFSARLRNSDRWLLCQLPALVSSMWVVNPDQPCHKRYLKNIIINDELNFT